MFQNIIFRAQNLGVTKKIGGHCPRMAPRGYGAVQLPKHRSQEKLTSIETRLCCDLWNV